MKSPLEHPDAGAAFAEPVAIVGVGGIFPGARTLEQYWSLIERGVDTSRPVPKGRWILDPAQALDPVSASADHVYTDRGCFVDPFDLDVSGLNLPVEAVGGLDPSVHLLLEAGRNAWVGARTEAVDRSRVGIVLGNIVLPTTASSTWCERVLTPLATQRVFGRSRPAFETGTAALGRHSTGLPAGVLARALGLGGGAYTLDAACASSLYALKLACDELLSGRTDAMLAGGLSRPDSLYTQMGFCQLRALATSGRCAPFDASASGLIVGEGAGVVVLKRLSDALREGDRIHALIRGIGLSNDLDGNLLSPSSEGQSRALAQAYRQAGWSPNQVDLIECHATGTPVGDAVEFASLLALWRDCPWIPGQCALGAVKANIGHLLTASGAAGLIKILLALEHDTLPIVANFQRPSAKIALADSPFRILRQGQAWHRRDARTPRRAAINGFGFGGINAHVLIEEWIGQPESRPARTRPERAAVPVAIVGLAAHVGPWPTLRRFQERVLGGGIEEESAERAAWRGVPGEELRSVSDGEPRRFPGYYLEDLSIPMDRYRIPPKELAELLPQQAVMIEAARSALEDARLAPTDPARTGVFIGLGLDARTADFHFRWAVGEHAALWGDELFARATASEKALWTRQMRDGAGPALTADRTLGALAGVCASRVAKEFHFGGPSHTVCNEEGSGIRALEIAVRALQQGELDQAVAGAVDVTGDWRALVAADAVRPYSRSGIARPFDAEADGAVPGEGAVALVLKRLDDARRDGNRVYAVIRGLGAAIGGGAEDGVGEQALDAKSYRLALQRAYREAEIDPASVGYVEANGSGHPEDDRGEAEILAAYFGAASRTVACHLGSVKADVGHAGAASGLISVVKASLALYQEVLPPLRGLRQPISELTLAEGLVARTAPQYWVRNRAEGPRRAGVSSVSVDGNCLHVVLEACEDQEGDRIEWERAQPLGPRAETLFIIQAREDEELVRRLQALETMAARPAQPVGDATSQNGGHRNLKERPLEWLARQWCRSRPREDASGCAVAIVAKDKAQLARLVGLAMDRIRADGPSVPVADQRDRDRVFYTPIRERMRGEIAFVFPGSGNQFAEMGRELALQWPEVLRAQDRENLFLANQLFIDVFWNTASDRWRSPDHRALICGQVALGTLVSDMALRLGIKPGAAIGYSLGESTSLFALRAWTARDEMWRRVSASTLFTRDLVGQPEVLAQVWKTGPNEAVAWKAGLVDRSAAEVGAAMVGFSHVYILIVNTPQECVLGGNASELEAIVSRLGCHWWPLEGVSTVHCELLNPVEEAYRELHLFDTVAPAGVRFYSGGWGRAYTPDRETAADAIVAQARDRIDFPRVIRAAYDSGVRFFIEIGPGNSCSRMIGRILEGQPHAARSLCVSAQEPLLNVLRVLGCLAAEGVPVDLEVLYGGPLAEDPPSKLPMADERRQVRIAITGPPLTFPLMPVTPGVVQGGSGAESHVPTPMIAEMAGAVAVPALASGGSDPFEAALLTSMAGTQTATLEAHRTYLSFAQGVAETLARTVQSQIELISAASATGSALFASTLVAPAASPAVPPSGKSVALARSACLEFARGSVARVLGEAFREVDTYPTRVRLPDEPLMLVDRILEIEAEPRSMTSGRVVTEHDIHAGAWYLDCGRIPTCIAVEAGQADLFLSGYLGIDFQTRGLAVYRLLDARVCFHRGLPGPGTVIHYDIRIERFFRQGDTWLFRFSFEATVDGQPLLTMTEGCAGFFSAAELAGGRGIVRPALEQRTVVGKRAADWEDFVSMRAETYSSAQLDALRAGDLASCFGEQFANLPLREPLTLPGGRMKLVHRISSLEPAGGRFGLGLIRGEADIHPDDWFLTCHFVDDRVMPGTLMFECCLHTLRVFLLRLGWVAEKGEVVLEPIPGIASQLKCRGQVLATTATVTYEIAIKELGYGPEPFAVADALMCADGKPIVEMLNLTLRYSGVTRDRLREIWPGARGSRGKLVLFDRDRILAFAIGKPSEAFGEPYRVFDEQRRIARLPGPPYQFLDRIVALQAEPFKMVAGGVVEAEYDIPQDAWYFAENRQGDMPFAVLLEIALQPCGWLAAYIGSALSSEVDLSFRNLGGTGTQLVPIWPTTGTLTTRVKITRLSSSAGMIIQWFEFAVRAGKVLVYEGDTYFGFFPKAALLRQEGLQKAALYQPGPEETTRQSSLDFPRHAPYPDEQWRMVDRIDAYVPEGGPHRLGFIRATKRVNPDEWFFKAHFYQDPVVPGSLGLESFLQLLKFLAIQRWGHAEGCRWEAVAMREKQEWTYRGQIIPRDRLITVEAVVTRVNDEDRTLTGDGYLSVDDRVIYAMKSFTVRRQTPRGPGM